MSRMSEQTRKYLIAVSCQLVSLLVAASRLLSQPIGVKACAIRGINNDIAECNAAFGPVFFIHNRQPGSENRSSCHSSQ